MIYIFSRIRAKNKIAPNIFLPPPLDFCDLTLNFLKYPFIYSYFSNDQPPIPIFFNHTLLEIVVPLIKLLNIILSIYLSQKMLISSKLLHYLKKKNSTQCLILLLFLLFSQINGMDRFNPPPLTVKDMDRKHTIKTKVNPN